MKCLRLSFTCIVFAAVCAGTLRMLRAADRLTIVLLLIDDWAWNGTPLAMDDSVENSRMAVVQMPNVERLAHEEMKFTNAYASPQCSPSRVCVQTGQSSPRNGFTVYMNRRGREYYDESKAYKSFPVLPCVSDMTIDPDAVTVPETLRARGYVSAHIGKWQMGGDPGDEGYVVHDGDTDNKPANTLRAGFKEGEKRPKRLPADFTNPKLLFSVTKKAIAFMEQQVQAGKPFYLQVSRDAHHRSSMSHSAIFKCTNDPPTIDSALFVRYDGLPSDHDLKLAGEAGGLLRWRVADEIIEVPKRAVSAGSGGGRPEPCARNGCDDSRRRRSFTESAANRSHDKDTTKRLEETR